MVKKLAITAVLLFILVVISFIYKDKTNFILENNKNQEVTKNNISINNKSEKPKEEGVVIKLKSDDKIDEIDLEEYIIGVVACEMPASFNLEALKAQAVAARTFALRKYEARKNKSYTLTNGTSDQCYHNNNILKKKWGSNYKKYYNKIKKAVTSTKGEYLTYNNKIITAFYFSMSNGFTEYSENVFTSSRPYLVSVSSSWDKDVNGYEQTVSFKEKDFLKKLEIDDNEVQTIKILSRYKTNRVNKIKVNNKTFSGVNFRTLLSLRSTDFDIKFENNVIKITTRGYGHGVGMSQYGANGMAEENYTYNEILEYYYKNVEIKKYK